jgi:putative addiction module killer protein
MVVIRCWQDARGRKPVKEWLADLRQHDRSGALAVDRLLTKLAKAGRLLVLPDVRFLGDDLWELRDRTTGPGYRIYYTWVDESLVVLLVAGEKSTQDRDIKKARRRLENFGSDDGEQ